MAKRKAAVATLVAAQPKGARKLTAKQIAEHKANLKRISEFSAEQKAAAEKRMADYRDAVANENATMILTVERRARELLETCGAGEWPHRLPEVKPAGMTDARWQQIHGAQYAMHKLWLLAECLKVGNDAAAAAHIEGLRAIAIRIDWLPLVVQERKRRQGHSDKFAAENADRKARAIELYREVRPKHRKKTPAVEHVARKLGFSKGKVWEYLAGILP